MDSESIKNIFDSPEGKITKEFFEEIISDPHFKLERIISEGHSSPQGFWYDQEQNEFVLLLSGSAKLLCDDGQNFNLIAGDYVNIPAHKKHRVEWTDPNQKTFWLTLYY